MHFAHIAKIAAALSKIFPLDRAFKANLKKIKGYSRYADIMQ